MYTDPQSGITVSTNGSFTAESFMSTFIQVGIEQDKRILKTKELIREKYGFVYYVEANGWAYKCKQKGDHCYEGILEHYPTELIPELGELVCVGNYEWNGAVIYKIVGIQRSFAGLGHCTVYGEEVEEFIINPKTERETQNQDRKILKNMYNKIIYLISKNYNHS
ncbi:MAG: hypothetical protein M0R48_11425 [Candidatus Omnitrophica bacterium]|nr:hypothetical protein [Candidatus Omnitrophota bacterium]